MAANDKGGINVILGLLAVAGVLYWMDRRQKDLLATIQAGRGALLPGPGVPPEAVHPGTAVVEVSEESLAIDAAPPASIISFAPRLVTCTKMLPRHFYSERSAVYRKEIIKLNKAIGRLHRVARMARFTPAGMRHHRAKLIALQHKRDQLAACAGPLRVKPVPRVVSRGRIHRGPPGMSPTKWQKLMAEISHANANV